MTTRYKANNDVFGVSQFVYSDTKQGLTLCNRLSELLPHGSGINYNWQIEYKRGKLYAYNTFEAMNENGFYCHNYPFKAIYQYNKSRHEPCKICGSSGYRLLSDMFAYGWTFEKFVSIQEHIVTDTYKFDNLGYPDNQGLSFVCNLCHGKGYTHLPEFTLINVQFYGNRELSCCGYGLFDYISESLCLA